MLILTRRPGDAILIDGGIRVVVLACDSRGVRLGIEAPTKVGIVREEVVARIADENRRANVAGQVPAWLDAAPPTVAPSGEGADGGAAADGEGDPEEPQADGANTGDAGIDAAP